MTPRYDPAPKRFRVSDSDEHEQQYSAVDPQEAYETLLVYADERADADVLAIEDETAGEALMLMFRDRVVARARASEGSDATQVEYRAVERAHGYWTFAMSFFADGYEGLDHAGGWFSDIADLYASPEGQGVRRAAAVSTEREAIDELCRIWSDSGIVDPTDQYYVFFHTHTLDTSRAERTELAKLVEILELERVEAPADAANGEVWMRTDPRIDAELEQWS